MIPVTNPGICFGSCQGFCGNGIKAFLFDELRPTPELSLP